MVLPILWILKATHLKLNHVKLRLVHPDWMVPDAENQALANRLKLRIEFCETWPLKTEYAVGHVLVLPHGLNSKHTEVGSVELEPGLSRTIAMQKSKPMYLPVEASFVTPEMALGSGVETHHANKGAMAMELRML